MSLFSDLPAVTTCSDSDELLVSQAGVFGRVARSATGLVKTPNPNWFVIDANANVVAGSGSVARGATDGFLYLPTVAGVPSGTPTAKAGLVPFVFDSTDKKIYAYTGGAWVAGSGMV